MATEQHITTKERARDDTLNLQNVLGVRVIAQGGAVIGRVREVRTNPLTFALEGVVVRRGLFARPLYIGASYISLVSEDSVILTIDPFVLLLGKRVIDHDGRSVGTVRSVERKKTTNTITALVVRSLFRKQRVIPSHAILLFGDHIILKERRHVKKTYFWQKS